MDEDLERHSAAVFLENDLALVDFVALVLIEYLLDYRPILQLDLEEVGEREARRIQLGLVLVPPRVQLSFREFLVNEPGPWRHQVRVDAAVLLLVAIEVIRLLQDSLALRQI